MTSNPNEPTDAATADTPAAPPERLKILGLKARNVLRLSAVQLHPDGKSVVLGGPNMAGKSSTLDAIAMTLAGKKRGPKVALPLRTGAVKGEVQIDLGAYVVTRTWTRSSDSLVVSAGGVVQASPQALLDKLIGDVAFDPLSFLRKDDGEQARILRKLVGLDTGDLDERIAALAASRKAANAEVKRLKAVADSTVLPSAPLPVPAIVSVSTLLEERGKLQAEIARLQGVVSERAAAGAAVTRERAALDEAQGLADALADELSALGETDTALKMALTGVERSVALLAKSSAGKAVASACAQLASASVAVVVRATEAADELEALRDDVLVERKAALERAVDRHGDAVRAADGAEAAADKAAARVSAIDEEIRGAEEANANAAQLQRAWAEYERARDAYKSVQGQLSTWEGDAERFDHEMELVEEERRARLAKAKFPVEGLAVDGDLITFRGVPLAQASHAERLRVVVAIAAALNPTLGVVIIREGAFLDDNGLREMLAAVEAAGLQAWVEVVGDREGVTVLIEDGAVKEER